MAMAAAKKKTTKPAAKASRRKAKPPPAPILEELYFRSDSAYFCMLLNRRTRSMRVIDFRAGALPAKRLYIQSVAQRENVEKVFTLVEKDEVSSWTRVGFVREGTIPGFYKRSDGHLCGCVIGEKTASEELPDASVRAAERTIAAAKKAADALPDSIKGVAVKEVDEAAAYAARDSAWRSAKDKPVASFDSFGRDAERLFYEVSYRRSKANHVMVEYQDCFGHALFEILRPPASENGLLAIVEGVRRACDRLVELGIVAGFAFGAVDDVDLATAYMANGFRKTGLLAKGAIRGDKRRDAILWTRKLANPAGEAPD